MARTPTTKPLHLKGTKGHDTLIGGVLGDSINAMHGNDTIIGGGGGDTLKGGGGADTFKYLAFSDSVGSGIDRITDFNAASGDKVDLSTLKGTDGKAATLLVAYNADFSGLQAVFAYNALTNTTTLSYYQGSSTAVFRVDFTGNVSYSPTAFLGIVLPSGPTEGNDNLVGTAGHDLVNLLGGEDTYDGLAGNDTINGGAGNDTLNGGEGDDALYGGSGDDTIDGGDGMDTVRFSGSPSAHDFSWNSAGQLVVTGEHGTDVLSNVEFLRFEINASEWRTIAVFQLATEGSDDLYGTWDHDLIHLLAGNDSYWAGEGNDVVYGGDGDDFLAGEGGDDILFGGDGHDFLQGGGLTGGTGTNYLYGEAGEDSFTAHRPYWDWGGFNYIDGGTGNDTFYLSNNFSAVANAAGAVHVTNVGNGYSASVTNVETWLAPETNGGGIYVDLSTLSYDVTLVGGGFTDTLIGGSGNDTIYGSHAGDTLTGGAGADTFRYSSIDESAPHSWPGDARDSITDFTSGTDKVDLSALGYMTFSGSVYRADHSHVAQVVITGSSGAYALSVYRAGSITADMVINMNAAALLDDLIGVSEGPSPMAEMAPLVVIPDMQVNRMHFDDLLF